MRWAFLFIYLLILKLLCIKGQLLDVRDPDSGRSTCMIMKKMNDNAETVIWLFSEFFGANILYSFIYKTHSNITQFQSKSLLPNVDTSSPRYIPTYTHNYRYKSWSSLIRYNLFWILHKDAIFNDWLRNTIPISYWKYKRKLT
jgi:tRNA(Met) C34 N-acetyltransferase TmcA